MKWDGRHDHAHEARARLARKRKIEWARRLCPSPWVLALIVAALFVALRFVSVTPIP